MKTFISQPISQSKESKNPSASRQASLDSIFQAYQRSNNRNAPIQTKEISNGTGLPDSLKTGVENLSGYSLDDVQVHYNSDKPARINALAYTQGNQIHVAPGEERHLPHEAWHVVQQKQGRVQPTLQQMGVHINDNAALEQEASEMGLKSAGYSGQKTSPDQHDLSDSRYVVQAVRDVATFRGQTPGTEDAPRDNLQSIDVALEAYLHASGGNKLTQANTLLAAINAYLLLPDIKYQAEATSLQAELDPEIRLLKALGGSNETLFEDLLQRSGGIAHIEQLIQVTTKITIANAAQLPYLIQLTGGAGNLLQLGSLINHIGSNNAYLLSGLIPLAGGSPNLVLLDSLIAATPDASLLLLFNLIPTAGGQAGLLQLTALIEATGAATVPQLPHMIANAGGNASIPDIINVINLNHRGNGAAAEKLTQVAAGDPGRFHQLAGILPYFLRAAPSGAVPPNVTAEITNYNMRTGGSPPAGGNLPFGKRIGQVEYKHFLQRHTMHYFDFAGIGPTNDVWPFTGSTTDTPLSNVLASALQTVYGNTGNWWIEPNAPQAIIAGGFQATIGTKTGGPPLPNPMSPSKTIASLILGQFYPMPTGGGGVIPMDRNDMEAIQQLL